ncbi:MAG TPA: transcription antitermination factor NusB [Candidatus Brocadiia bacterium]|nr:transcription antitermination factor NusB [Candidatus Brocadiia bacterium]
MPRPDARPRGANPRRHALEIVSAALAGRAFVQDQVDALARSGRLSKPDLGLAAEIAYTTVRRLATLDAVLAPLSSRPLEDLQPALLNILRCAACQLLFLDRIPAHAAVDEAVRLARSTGHGRASGFINAVLRQLTRSVSRGAQPAGPATRRLPLASGQWLVFTYDVLPTEADAAARLAAVHSFPPWLAARWLGRYGAAETERLFALANTPAPACLRPNAGLLTPRELLQLLRKEGVEASLSQSGRTARLAPHTRVQDLGVFQAGLAQPQDDSAAAVALFANPQPGQAVLDLCAAPGGKTTHLLELAPGARVTAVDLTAQKLRMVEENVRRLGLPAPELVHAEGEAFCKAHPDAFDTVLLDAPCSNSGVLRRRPEARWRLTAAAIRELAALQGRLLRAALAAVKPGGSVVYATCSIEPEENQELVRACARETGAALEDEKAILPTEEGDGAYMARLRRAAGPGGVA